MSDYGTWEPLGNSEPVIAVSARRPPTTAVKGVVRRTSDKAVLFKPASGAVGFWVPRSVIENGDRIDKGDTDIRIETWWWHRS